MTVFDETARWEESIYQIRTVDPVLGGLDGTSNIASGQLANRTQWLKEEAQSSRLAISQHAGQLQAHAERIDDHAGRLESQDALLQAHKTADNPYPQYQGVYRAVAQGTSDAIVADFGVTLPEPPADQTLVFVRAAHANASPAPTFSTVGTQTRPIVKGNNQPLKKGDITGAGFEMLLQYSALFDKWVLVNPAWGEYAEATTPVGAMMYWPLPEPPFGWLERNGAAVSRATFAELFAVIGTTYGAGDGSSTFHLPDDRGNFERGWDHGIGIDAGRGFGTVQGDAIRNIESDTNFTLVGGGSSYALANVTSGTALQVKLISAGKTWGSAGNWSASNYFSGLNFNASRVVPTASENRPRNRAYLPIIKYR